LFRFPSRYPSSDLEHFSSSVNISGSAVRSASLAHAATMLPVSCALVMSFRNSLSILLNFFASSGICFAMSPPVNTDSRLHQSSCTFCHSSSTSVVSVSSFNLACTSARNGVTFFSVSMV
jgi:hypothetical protein